jgi:hypothetical protein
LLHNKAASAPSSSSGFKESNSNGSPIEDCIMENDRISLADFLREIIMPTSQEDYTPHNAVEISISSIGRDAFNFGIDTSMEFTDIDLGWLESQNFRHYPPVSSPVSWEFSGISEQDVRPGRVVSDPNHDITSNTKLAPKSVWRRWKPVKQRHAFVEQAHLSLSPDDIRTLETRTGPEVLKCRLKENSRDEILSMVLANSEPSNKSQISASFPSIGLLNTLMQGYFISEFNRIDSWIHIPTFDPDCVSNDMLRQIIFLLGAPRISSPLQNSLLDV